MQQLVLKYLQHLACAEFVYNLREMLVLSVSGETNANLPFNRNRILRPICADYK